MHKAISRSLEEKQSYGIPFLKFCTPGDLFFWPLKFLLLYSNFHFFFMICDLFVRGGLVVFYTIIFLRFKLSVVMHIFLYCLPLYMGHWLSRFNILFCATFFTRIL